MKYGELIKERRAVLGLTQQDLSDYTELRAIRALHYKTYSRIQESSLQEQYPSK